MNVYLERRRVFSCAHRYWNPKRDDAWNAAHFGALTRVHGHNYTLTAAFAGEVNPLTGIVVNLADVKVWLRDAVVPFEGNSVDAATPIMEGLQPSTENLAQILWRRLAREAAGTPARLARVRVAESEDVHSEYEGDPTVVYVTKSYEFSAAHRLHSKHLGDEENARIFGKCNHPGGHGHNYGLEVTVKGPIDMETGFAFDLARLDAAVQSRVLDSMDHRNLNEDVPQFGPLNPTSENLAVVIWRLLTPDLGDALHRVRVQETSRNAFEYLGE
ncbi:MAG TPA: 6-carboxytetrahydropterin synthase [Armatimonadota bacterium]|jgi:6-pyruvoyltetrahydropterin/6-carboxytetrahydropterin synthase